MTNNPQQSIDEILGYFKREILTNEDGKRGEDWSVEQAKAALKEVVDGIIGLDECDDYTEENTQPNHEDWAFRNELRSEQRKRAEEVFGDDK